MTEIPHKHRLYGQKEFSPFIGRFTVMPLFSAHDSTILAINQ